MARDLEGKVFLVTGATEGIGKIAAQDFATRGATVVLVGRNKDKSERVVSEIKAASGSDKVELLLGDMSLKADIRRVADEFRASHDRLDVLVNNAGAVFLEHELTADGIEKTFALNHVGYFLLTKSLLDLLEKTPGSRVISTASAAHRAGKMDLSTIAKRNGKAGFDAYGDSKLANILFTRELARRAKGVVVNCVHPGWVHTGFAMNNQGFIKTMIGLMAPLFARTPEKGAETVIWAATSPEAAQHNGEYFFDKKIGKTTPRAKDDDLARGLWELTEQLCG